jgi:MFS transporter, FHS family, Na+ dependent glucose transporter 1
LLTLAIAFPGSSAMVWIAALGVGFCMAPVWPTGFTLAGQSVNLTGKVAAIILLGDSFGGMVLPTVVGQVIDRTGAGAMTWLVAGSLVLNLVAFAFVLRLHAPKLQPQA